MEFRDGTIDGVLWLPLSIFHDDRGWLCELFRRDDVHPDHFPAMGYLSMTEAGVTRGPHEHLDQTDYFCFLGPSNFKIYLWDTRPQSPTYRVRQIEVVGIDKPMTLIVPPGIVHAYKNIGSVPGLVVNCPNRLYKGPGRQDPVDEIRHENRGATEFRME